jgi:hypothetical protein
MTSHPPKGQLLFDLLGPVTSRPSPFEQTLWIARAAADQRASDEAQSDGDGPGALAVDETRDEVDDSPDGDRSLRLVAGEEEPPLDSTVAGHPGPRVAAFASAMGASVMPTKPESRDAGQRELAAPASTVGVEVSHSLGSASPPSEASLADREAVTAAGEAGPATSVGECAADSATAERQQAEAASADGAPASRPLPPVVHDDDFGPLVLVEPKRRRRGWPKAHSARSTANIKRSRGRVLLGVAALVLGLVAVAVWWVGNRPAAVVAGSASIPAVGADLSMVTWQGMALPISASAGPTTYTGDTARGFAHSALGAAIAAAHLSVRTDPVAGPAAFEPVLASQVVGDVQRLSQAVRVAYAQGAGQPAPGVLLGWWVDGFPSGDAVTVHLAVDPAGASSVDFAVPLVWVDGDWRINAASEGDFFPVTDMAGDYEPFPSAGQVPS